jgi:hypothetical protein
MIYSPQRWYQDASPRVKRSGTSVSRLGHCHAGIKQRKRVAYERKNDTSNTLVAANTLVYQWQQFAGPFGLCRCFWTPVNVKTIAEFAEAVTFLICVGYVPPYVLCCDTGYLRTISVIFLIFVRVNTGLVLQLRLEHFLSCCVLSIMHRSSWHLTLYFDILTLSLVNQYFFSHGSTTLLGLDLLCEFEGSHHVVYRLILIYYI